MPGGEEGRFEHFMSEQFAPFLERFDKHLEADDRRFEMMATAVNRISTTMEVQASIGTALAKKADSLFNRRNAAVAIVVAAMGPVVAVVIAVWK